MDSSADGASSNLCRWDSPGEQAALQPCAAELCILQYDTRVEAADESELHQGELGLLMRATRLMCQSTLGCSYLRKPPSNEITPYWAKVQMMETSIVKLGCAASIWIDSDAVIHHRKPDMSWANQLFAGRDMFISADPCTHDFGLRALGGARSVSSLAHSCTTRWRATFNAGIFGIRNSAIGRGILRSWLAKFHPANWHLAVDGTWQCQHPDNRTCPYAGKDYEQAAFTHGEDAPARAFAESISSVPACQINTPCYTRRTADCRGAHTCHFLGNFRTNLSTAYLQSDEDPNGAAAGNCDHAAVIRCNAAPVLPFSRIVALCDEARRYDNTSSLAACPLSANEEGADAVLAGSPALAADVGDHAIGLEREDW